MSPPHVAAARRNMTRTLVQASLFVVVLASMSLASIAQAQDGGGARF
jgi:hypothetical protein